MTASKPLVELQQFLPYRMASTASHISQGLAQVYGQAPFSLALAEWRILAQLARSGEANAKVIAQLTDMDKTKVSRGVKTLEAKGLLHKRQDSQDNRATNLSLNQQGWQLYRDLAPLALAWESSLLSALTDAERQALFQILDKLDRQLERPVLID
ncbi:MarR family winged helix-turn-helix transcriptional regulator [Ferrimonas marina]|uniref:DNA-binding transcriptional regulator, MarR family n=1 Tax=Ferrimonas marina TaxID=299255 RepID=A0A1M5VA52_9GAMM|nr:MarR family winged helix-turn-helix transcriptional regulator [Ferrimonas marina]SHH72028.1 DNA-binding transcriptional regulator, MarR family [Ferrimonas marina]